MRGILHAIALYLKGPAKVVTQPDPGNKYSSRLAAHLLEEEMIMEIESSSLSLCHLLTSSSSSSPRPPPPPIQMMMDIFASASNLKCIRAFQAPRKPR